MKSCELKKLLLDGALDKYSALYSDTKEQAKRFIAAVETFEKYYGRDRDVAIFSVPGRSEICGNHTDHNHGAVLAGAINRDIIAVAAKNDDGVIRFQSEGYSEDVIDISRASDPKNFRNFTSRALVGGLVGDDKVTGELATTGDGTVLGEFPITQGTLKISDNYIIKFSSDLCCKRKKNFNH